MYLESGIGEEEGGTHGNITWVPGIIPATDMCTQPCKLVLQSVRYQLLLLPTAIHLLNYKIPIIAHKGTVVAVQAL